MKTHLTCVGRTYIDIYSVFQSFHGKNAALKLQCSCDSQSFCLFVSRAICQEYPWPIILEKCLSIFPQGFFRLQRLRIAGRGNKPQMETLPAPTCAHLWKRSCFKIAALVSSGHLLGPSLRYTVQLLILYFKECAIHEYSCRAFKILFPPLWSPPVQSLK